MKQIIMLAGPSGVGKTTICHDLCENDNDLDFRSGSVSDLLPETKEMTHKDMLSRDNTLLYKEDYQILNIRKKLVTTWRQELSNYTNNQGFISDRSFLDLAAYFWLKQIGKLPSCEIMQFIQLCNMVNTQNCDKLILVNFTKRMIDGWVIEDNNKRITSNLFQYHVASIMREILNLWGYKPHSGISRVPQYKKWGLVTHKYIEDNPTGYIENIYGTVPVLILNTTNREDRKKVIREFIYR